MAKVVRTVGESRQRKRQPTSRRTARPGFFSMLLGLILKEVSATRSRNHSSRQEAIRYNRRKYDQAGREWMRRQRDAERRIERERVAEERVRRKNERPEPQDRPSENKPQRGAQGPAQPPEDAAVRPDVQPEQLEIDYPADGERSSAQTELPLDSFGTDQMSIPGMD